MGNSQERGGPVSAVPGSGAILGATVLPMERPSDSAQAIAWKDGVILHVGNDDDVLRVAEAHGLPVTDGESRLVVPGFVDAHMHFLHVGVKRLRPDLRGAGSMAEAFDRTRRWLDDHPGDDAVIAEGWDESGWPENRFPTKEELDAFSGNRPLVFRRIDGHIAVGNSAVLPRVKAHWPEWVDEATGILEEPASLYLNEVIPVSDDDLDLALEMAQDVSFQRGVTAIGEYAQAPYRQAYLRAAAADRLRLRIACSIYVQQLDAAIGEGFRTGRRPVDGPGSGWYQDGGLKVFLDGSFGGRTALMREPYQDGDGEERGARIWTPQQVDDLFGKADAAGIQIHAHAIGDRAIDEGLDGFEAISEGDGSLRHRFEHYELPHDDAVQRTVAAGVTACAQPNFVGEWSAPGGMYEQRMGPVFRLNNRYRTFLDAGLTLCFGSDGMPFGPLVGLKAALQHPVADERVSPREAIWLYTHAAARAIHWEHEIGSLSAGKRADLVLLDITDVDQLAEASVRQTYTDGVSRLSD